MESSFFYYSGKDFFNNYREQTKRSGTILAVPHDDLPEENSGITGYSVVIDLKTADENTRIIVPETDKERPVDMLRIRMFSEKFKGNISPIKYIYISASVKYIEVSFSDLGYFNIFNGCTVEISPDNPYFRVYEHGVYTKDMSELHFIFSPNEVFTVPDGVKTIKSDAGLGIKGIKKLTVPESVEKIEWFAFCRSGIEEAEISAKRIANSAFSDNIHLKKLTLSDFEHISGTAFAGCKELTTVIAKNAKQFDLNVLHGISDKLNLNLDCGRIFDSSCFPGMDIRRIALSWNVKKLGKKIISDGVLEIVSVNNKLNFSYKNLLRASELGAVLSVRCAETDEILYEIDLWFRADIFHNGSAIDTKYCQRITNYNGVYDALSDACGYYRRYRELANFKKDAVFKPLRQYVHELAAAVAWGLTADGNYEKLSELQCFDFIDDKHFCDLIGYSAKQGMTVITALLMQKLHEKGGGNAPGLEL